MSVQIRCPLCGLTRPPERMGQYDLAAKEVRSLGGDRGFEHTEVDMPERLEQRIEEAIARLYHMHVRHDPFSAIQEQVAEAAEGAVEEFEEREEMDTGEIEEEIEAAIEAAVGQLEQESEFGEIEREIDVAVRSQVGE